MIRKFVGMDLETVKITPPGEDWQQHRPLGISCAAFVSRTQSKVFSASPDNKQMTTEEVRQMVDWMENLERHGATFVTWNGLYFDWSVIAEESDDNDRCQELAINHVDMMYHLFCAKGFPLSLASAAQGMRVGSKTENMTGELAPKMWADGRRQEVMDYCHQDAQLTLSLAITCEQNRRLDWVSRSNRLNRLQLPDGWLSVRDAADMDLPDTNWMENPIPRARFDTWVTNALIRAYETDLRIAA